jgi:hypothetical protein
MCRVFCISMVSTKQMVVTQRLYPSFRFRLPVDSSSSSDGRDVDELASEASEEWRRLGGRSLAVPSFSKLPPSTWRAISSSFPSSRAPATDDVMEASEAEKLDDRED